MSAGEPPSAGERQSDLNAALVGMPDNCWLNLRPEGRAYARMYSGCCAGAGYVWYFGGAHRGCKGSDVQRYDPRAKRWIQATEPECPEIGSLDWKAMVSDGGTPVISHPPDDPKRKTPTNRSASRPFSRRLTDRATFPAQVHDCKAAVRWLRAHDKQYGYNATRIGVAGTSAGGYLALMLGVTGDMKELEGAVGGNVDQSSRVQAIVDYYGPTDFVLRSQNQPSKTEQSDSPVRLLLGVGDPGCSINDHPPDSQ